MREVCERIGIPFLSRVMIVYLPPNHQLMDLEPLEKDDLVMLGTRNDIVGFGNQFDLGKQIAMMRQINGITFNTVENEQIMAGQ